MSHRTVDGLAAVNSARNTESVGGNGALLGQASARVEGSESIWHPDRPATDAVELSPDAQNGALVQAPVWQPALFNSNVIAPPPGMQAGAVYGRSVQGVAPGMQAGAVYSANP